MGRIAHSLLGPALLASLLAHPSSAGEVGLPVLKWQRGGCFSSWCQTGWYSSPAVADVDGDGQADVIWGSYDVVALRGTDGGLKWRAPNSSRVWPGIVVADLTGDGTLEVIVGRGSDQLTVYDRFGGVIWSANPFGSGEVRTLAVADLDSDGRLEIVVGRASGGATKQLSVYEAAGTVRPGWPARRDGEPGYGWGMYNENVTVGDFDGDGRKEIIGPTDTHYITALDPDGNQLLAHPMYGSGKVWSQVGVHVDHAVDLRGYADCGVEHRPNFANTAPAMGDLDGDGVPEIVVVGDVYNCAIGDPDGDLYHLPWILRRDRTRWSGGGYDWTALPTPVAGAGPLSQDYALIQNSVQNVVLADLDGDGRTEILYPSYDGRLHAYWLDKTQHGSWPYKVPGTGIRFASEPVVADLDGDGRAEVIFTSWPENGGGRLGQLHILDYLGNPLQAVNLPPPFGGTWNGGLGAPTLADIDGDPDLEVVVGTTGSGVVAYDLPNTASARILWGTGRGSNKRTGLAPPQAKRPPDLTLLVRSGTGTGRTEAHVMDGGSGFQSWRLNVAMALGETGSGPDWWFLRGDYNRDKIEDLYVIRKASTGSGRTELHVLNGASSFQSWLVNLATALGETGSDAAWVFALGDHNGDGFNDLYAIGKSRTGSGRTEVHVLSGGGAMQSWLLNVATALPQVGSDASWMFLLGDYNRDRKLDLYVVARARPGSAHTEVHVLNGADGFQSWLLNVATPLPTTGSDLSWMFVLGDYNGDGALDLYSIFKTGTGSGKTEVHVLDGGKAFQTWLANIATAQGTVGNDWGRFFPP